MWAATAGSGCLDQCGILSAGLSILLHASLSVGCQCSHGAAQGAACLLLTDEELRSCITCGELIRGRASDESIMGVMISMDIKFKLSNKVEQQQQVPITMVSKDGRSEILDPAVTRAEELKVAGSDTEAGSSSCQEMLILPGDVCGKLRFTPPSHITQGSHRFWLTSTFIYHLTLCFVRFCHGGPLRASRELSAGPQRRPPKTRASKCL